MFKINFTSYVEVTKTAALVEGKLRIREPPKLRERQITRYVREVASILCRKQNTFEIRCRKCLCCKWQYVLLGRGGECGWLSGVETHSDSTTFAVGGRNLVMLP